MSEQKRLLPVRDGTDLSDWYTAVIQLADLADYGPAKGTMIIKPYGYAIWELVQRALDDRIKAGGVSNAYFPLLIPMNFLEREKKHVEGFAPELAVVTIGGGEKLEEPLVVRPTSETIMYDSYGKWVQSWRDLPILINQWNNVVRWEKRTMPFLRTSEFLWQEGHTAHATRAEANERQKWAMDQYADVYRNYFALDGYVGYKSESERFAGADSTLTYEAMMPSGKVLQSSTSHDLGQNFSKVFDINFQDEKGDMQYVYQTSWGFSTRSIGGLILAHGDDNGLRLPPKVAPVQVVIVPVRPDAAVLDYCGQIEAVLKGTSVRVSVDARDDESFGFKLNKWEVKGAPLIFKIGGKEAEAKQVTAKKRYDGSEISLSFDSLQTEVPKLLEAIQGQMLEASRAFLASETREAKTYDEFKQIAKDHRGFIKVYWNENADIEAKIKAETKAKTSCWPLDLQPAADAAPGVDFYTGEPAKNVWLFAQSY